MNKSAFPIFSAEQDGTKIKWGADDGLTKREFFAAMAMQGLLSCKAYPNSKQIGETAIEVADEVLKKLMVNLEK